MPLLKRKRFPLLSPPPYDPHRKESRDRQVWYSPITAEIFTDYTTYLQRTQLYKQPIWQCETTGRGNLTYAQALESERLEKERVQDKLPEQLQRRVLQRAQFQTGRLDNVVDDVYNYYAERYAGGEIVNCRWDDGIVYNARILEILPATDEQGTPRYRVQLIDDQMQGIADFVKEVGKSEIKRDRLAFSKNLLKKFLRESMTKETYNGAPWMVKPSLAKKFGLETTMPKELQAVRDNAFLKKGRRRPTASTSGKRSTSRKIPDASKVEASLKYPMEDLDLPAYRREAETNTIIDMKPGGQQPPVIPNPTGDTASQWPQPAEPSTIASAIFGSFLMVWSFLSIFARPLGLFPFSLDDFEHALRHNSTEYKSHILIETNACLLNAIIKERKKSKSSGAASSNVYAPPLGGLGRQESENTLSSSSLEEDGHAEASTSATITNGSTTAAAQPDLARSCGSAAIMKIGHGWDKHVIPVENDREGWEDVLIGCMNELAPVEMMPQLDRIFNLLVPHENSTLQERQQAYLNLSLQDKIFILEFLVDVVNECSFIKEYMEECQEQMTELRKLKIDLSRERKRIAAERLELEKNTEQLTSNFEPMDTTMDTTEDDVMSGYDSNEISEQQEESSSSRRESRRVSLKRKQIEREEREAKKLKMYHQQREQARARNKELKAHNAARRKLEEEARQIQKKEEQLEHNMRRYNTLRIKPLGRDRFYNRYYYFDNLGGASTHGTGGRLYVQSPDEIDLTVLKERDNCMHAEDVSPCGHGGGVQFVVELMRAQGLSKEAEFMETQIKNLSNRNRSGPLPEWWRVYQDPEDLEKLLAWLNPKGLRENKLKRELEKHVHSLITGMKKRISMEQNAAKIEQPRRSTRHKPSSAPPPAPWLAYTNKYAK